MKLLGCVSKKVIKKPLLLLLALVCLAPAFASDNGFGVVESKGGTRAEAAAQAPVDAWGEVEERAGSPRITAGAGAGVGSATVELKIAGETLAIPQVSLDQFEMLPRFVEWSQLKPAGQSLEKNDIFNAENLRVLLDLVQNQRAEDYSLEELVDAVLLADYLFVRDWQALGENFSEIFLKKLNVQASPEIVLRISNMNSALRLPLIETDILARRLKNVFNIYWSPDASIYWVIFRDVTARRYNQAGEQQGEPLKNVQSINWSPDGSSYWVRFIDGKARKYNQAGMQQGVPLERVENIKWSPEGSSYWVRFIGGTAGGTAGRYNQAGEQQGVSLERVENIKWSPDGSSYWVKFDSDTARRYNQAGMQQGVRLEGVENIKWSTEGSSYWVRFIGGTAIKYNQAGVEQGEPLEGVENIKWSPDGSSYWLLFHHAGPFGRRAIRYNQAGEQQGVPLENVQNIKWNPGSLGYWVIFRDGVARKYNQAGGQQGERLEHVENIKWSPDASGYWVFFHDGSAKLYKSIFNNLPLYEQLLVQYIMNHKNSTGKAARLAKEYLDLLSPDTLKRLQAAGYLELFYQVGDYVGWFDINDAGVGAGAGAGSGASGSKDLDHDQVD